MPGSRPLRGLFIRDSFVHGHQSEEIDPAAIEAERLHLAAITGCDFRYWHFDKVAIEDPMSCNLRLVEVVSEHRPDFIFYHPSISSYLIHRNVRPEFLFIARALTGASLVFSFGDVAYPYFAAYAAGYAAFGDVSVTWDGNGAKLAALAPPGKTILDLWTPTDRRVFRETGVERDIDVGVIGQTNNYRDRQAMLAALKGLGIHVATGGGNEGEYLDVADYARLFNRTRISLNFSKTKEGVTDQLKGRVFESILCGALLFESENEVTARFLTPYRHYVPFGDAADLAEKIRRYLADEPARREMVAAAQAHVLSTLTEEIWWQRLLGAIDLSRAGGKVLRV